MYELDQDRWAELIEAESDIRLAIYLPTHEAGPQIRQDPIRLKNALVEATERLWESGLDSAQIDQRLGEAQRLVDDWSFWRHQRAGLALFIDETSTRYCRTSLQTVPELVVTGPHFYILPLVPEFERNYEFHILALSAGHVSLFRVMPTEIGPVDLAGAAANLSDAMSGESPRQLQYHKGITAHGLPASGSRPAVYHGQGVGTDQAQLKKQLTEYCRVINAHVVKALAGARTPLLLAAAEPLLSLFRSHCAYPGLVDPVIAGNPEPLCPSELQRLGFEILEERPRARCQRALEKVSEHVGTLLASTEVREVVIAAHDGRIDTLFVRADAHSWGSYDPSARTIQAHQNRQLYSEDLCNLAAVMTLRTGGSVHVLPPDGDVGYSNLAALFRYAA